jgi:hypothetical protein
MAMNQDLYLGQLGQLGQAQQLSNYRQYVPTPLEQLKTRRVELERFLAVDHERQRREAADELTRVNSAISCLETSAEEVANLRKPE